MKNSDVLKKGTAVIEGFKHGYEEELEKNCIVCKFRYVSHSVDPCKNCGVGRSNFQKSEGDSIPIDWIRGYAVNREYLSIHDIAVIDRMVREFKMESEDDHTHET